jgi:putative regulatory protein, FmdB family
MPTYEYDCSDCGERFEIRASIADERARDIRCTECDSPGVRRHYGAVAIVGNRRAGPAPGELRQTDAGDLTRDVARRYGKDTGDGAMKEIARRAERGDGPAELHELVREVKADREHQANKRGSVK